MNSVYTRPNSIDDCYRTFPYVSKPSVIYRVCSVSAEERQKFFDDFRLRCQHTDLDAWNNLDVD